MVDPRATIFVVDDDDAVRDSLAMLLEAEDYQVESFPSGTAFLEAPIADGAACVLLDVRMPGMDGLSVQRELAKSSPGLPVIMITGHGDIAMAVRAIKAGAADFIEKPFSDQAILDGIAQALASAARARTTEAQQKGVRQRIDRLTEREREVFEHLAAGQPNKVIARDLGISPRTVEVHRARVMEKLQARSLSHLVRMAVIADVELGEV